MSTRNDRQVFLKQSGLVINADYQMNDINHAKK